VCVRYITITQQCTTTLTNMCDPTNNLNTGSTDRTVLQNAIFIGLWRTAQVRHKMRSDYQVLTQWTGVHIQDTLITCTNVRVPTQIPCQDTNELVKHNLMFPIRSCATVPWNQLGCFSKAPVHETAWNLSFH